MITNKRKSVCLIFADWGRLKSLNMNSITNNVEETQNLIRQIKEHPMCYDMSITNDKLIVTFPLGYQYNGLNLSFVKGAKIYILRKALEMMEECWRIN